jgi:hypothetical protein
MILLITVIPDVAVRTVAVFANAIAIVRQTVLTHVLVALRWDWLLPFVVMVLLEAIQGDVFQRQTGDVDGKSERALRPALLLIALHHHRTVITLTLSLTSKVVK